MPRLYGTGSLPKCLLAVAGLAIAGCSDGVEFTGDGTRCAIESLGWVGVSRNDGKTNLDVGGHPASLGGGGDRIFPDRNNPLSEDPSATPNDDLHDRVIARLRLKSAPARFSGVHVRFELQDPDHYSSDPMHDPNGVSEPDDNIRAGSATPDSPGARLMDRGFKTEKQEELLVGDGDRKDVDIGVQLLHLQPGNNWSCLRSAEIALSRLFSVMAAPSQPDSISASFETTMPGWETRWVRMAACGMETS